MRPALGAFLVLALLAGGPAAEERLVQVDRVLDATTVSLVDGEVVRLAGIVVPRDVEARAAERLAGVLARSSGFRLVVQGRDRYRRPLGDLHGHDGLWLRELLVENGLAMAAPAAGQGGRPGDLLALERAARAAGRGMWQDGRVAEAGRAGTRIGQYALVRGRILSIGETKRYVYLNFGPNYRTDFTLRIRGQELDHVLPRYAEGLDRLVDRFVEARGFVLAAGGPLIELSHPDQLEVIR